MCESCGCGDPKIVPVDVHDRILEGNDRTARHNRHHFEEDGTLAINLMGSPGSGKTALLEATARAQGAGHRIGAISGDLATDNDAARLRAAGIPSVAITTGQACHLDAAMVHDALHDPPWEDVDWLFIENVGNLVCPAIYDLGQHANVVALSVTEGVDKPLKYPVMFRKADLVVLTKIDLLPFLGDVSIEAIRDSVDRVMPNPRVIAVSARTGEGLDAWIEWLRRAQPGAGRVLAEAGGRDTGSALPVRRRDDGPGRGSDPSAPLLAGDLRAVGARRA
jgi:hydrogenase nickel incorporation protein HypB